MNVVHHLKSEHTSMVTDKIKTGSPESREVAAYVAEFLLPLRNMSAKADLTFLAYLIEMAYEESLSESISEEITVSR